MKNLVAKAGLTILGSTLLLATAGAKSASALFIKATETFSVSEDVFYNPNIGTGSVDRQFRSYNPNPASVNGRYTPDDSIISSLASQPFNQGGDVTNMAIVGSFTSEEIRGMVEFSLQPYYQRFAELDNQANAIPEGTPGDDFTEAEAQAIKDKLVASALLNFNVFQQGGIHPDNQNPLANDLFSSFGLGGVVEFAYYEANGLEDLFDYGDGTSKSTGDPLPGTQATFLLDWLITQDLAKGQRVSFDISSAVADALNNGWSMLGFRLSAIPATSNPDVLGQCAFDATGQATSFADCGAITFNNFSIGAVPTPAAILPTLFGIAMSAVRKRKNQEEASL